MDKPPDMRPSSNYINNCFIYFRNITKVVWALLFVSTTHFLMISELISDFDLLKKHPMRPFHFLGHLLSETAPPKKKKRGKKKRSFHDWENYRSRMQSCTPPVFYVDWREKEESGGGGGCHFRGKMGDYWLSW